MDGGVGAFTGFLGGGWFRGGLLGMMRKPLTSFFGRSRCNPPRGFCGQGGGCFGGAGCGLPGAGGGGRGCFGVAFTFANRGCGLGL